MSGRRNWQDIVAGLQLELKITPSAGSSASNDVDYLPVQGDDFYRVCRDGERTQRLVRAAGSLIGGGLTARKATEILLALNRDKNEPPLEDEKIRKTVASIARAHSRNHTAEQDPDAPLFDLSAASVGRYLEHEAPPREWVLENCIPLGKAAVLVAPGGTGKSQLMLQMAYDVATGRQKLSPWAPSKPGKVIILSAEDEDEELHRRFRRLANDDMASADGLSTLNLLRENLFIVPRVGEDNLLTREQHGEVVPTALCERILKSIEGADQVTLIVIDPLSRFRGGEENSAEDTTRCVEVLEQLAKRSGAAVLAAHHTNKSSASGSEPNQHAARGSSALVDGVRLILNLSYENSGRRGQVRGDQLLELRITKTNYGPLGDPILLRRDSQGRLLGISGEEAEAQRLLEMTAKVVATLTAAATERQSYSKSTFATAFAGVDGLFGMGQAALKSFIVRLCDTGVLEIEDSKLKHLRVRRSGS